MVRSHVRQAKRIFNEAERHQHDGAWHLAVRRSQEAVEFSLKALLRHAGVEVPRVHDVGLLLRQHGDRLPPTITGDLDRIVSISRRLRADRETSFYGDEEAEAAPEELFSKVDAEQAVSDARFVLDVVTSALPPVASDRS